MKALLPLALLAAALLAAMPAEAKTDLTVTVGETTAQCAGKTFCFITNATGVAPGDVSLVLVNTGNIPHNICVRIATRPMECAPAGADVEPNSKVVSGGNRTTLNFTAPAEGTVEYWCNVSGHKDLGMAGTFAIEGASPTPPPSPPPSPSPSPSPSPPPSPPAGRSSPDVGLLAIAMGVGLLAVALRRK